MWSFLLINILMDYVTKYYKNLCEELSRKIQILEYTLPHNVGPRRQPLGANIDLSSELSSMAGDAIRPIPPMNNTRRGGYPEDKVDYREIARQAQRNVEAKAASMPRREIPYKASMETKERVRDEGLKLLRSYGIESPEYKEHQRTIGVKLGYPDRTKTPVTGVGDDVKKFLETPIEQRYQPGTIEDFKQQGLDILRQYGVDSQEYKDFTKNLGSRMREYKV